MLQVELEARWALAEVAAWGVDTDLAALTDSGIQLTFVYVLTPVLTRIAEHFCPRNNLVSLLACAVVAPLRVLAVCEFSTGH